MLTLGKYLAPYAIVAKAKLVPKQIDCEFILSKCRGKATAASSQQAQPEPSVSPSEAANPDRDIEVVCIPPPKKRRVETETKMDNFVTKTSRDQSEKLDHLLGRAFYGCNIPFAAVDHPAMVTFITTLRPGYKPPGRKALGEFFHLLT